MVVFHVHCLGLKELGWGNGGIESTRHCLPNLTVLLGGH